MENSTQAAYDPIAGWYDALVRSGSLAGDVVIPHLFNSLGNIEGQHICDLGCGQGRLTRQLARLGATVAGIDLSSELIAIVRRDELADPFGLIYLVDDAQTLSTLEDETFNGVVCNLALMDMPNLAGVFQAVWRVLRLDGWFVFTITHPCFEAPHACWTEAADGAVTRTISTYFVEGFWRSSNPNGVRGQVGAYHRMLSTYLTSLAQTGFCLEHVVEPQGSGQIFKQIPGYAVIPVFMIVRCRKGLG